MTHGPLAADPGPSYCRESESFWRHRKDCDYLVKGHKVYRMADGLVAFERQRAAEMNALLKRLSSGKYAARIKRLS